MFFVPFLQSQCQGVASLTQGVPAPAPINPETPSSSFLVSESSCNGSVRSVGWRFLAKSSTLKIVHMKHTKSFSFQAQDCLSVEQGLNVDQRQGDSRRSKNKPTGKGENFNGWPCRKTI